MTRLKVNFPYKTIINMTKTNNVYHKNIWMLVSIQVHVEAPTNPLIKIEMETKSEILFNQNKILQESRVNFIGFVWI